MDELDFYTKAEIDEKFSTTISSDTGIDFYTKSEIDANIGTPETIIIDGFDLDFYTKTEIDSIPTSRLPGGYQEIAYIESTGTQGINTGYSCSSGSVTLEADVEFTEIGSGDVNIFGTWDSGNNGPYFWVSPNESGTIRFNSNSMDNSFSSIKTWGSVPVIGVRYVIRAVFASNGTSMTINGDYFSGSGYGAGRPVIGVFQNGTRNSGHPKAKLYGAKITDGSTLARDFVPAIRTADNKPGLFDLVSQSFFTNAWSGDFIAP